MVWAGRKVKHVDVRQIVIGIFRFMVSLLRCQMADCRVRWTVLWPGHAVLDVNQLN
jgi:hypothetical protein